MTRRWAVVAGLAGLAGLAVLYARTLGRTRVRLDRFTVVVDRPGLPVAGLTILHLSDLHCRADDPIQAHKLASLRRLLADEQYDVLALTGDLIHDEAGLPVALEFLGQLRPRLGGFSCPGNHDYWESSLWGILGQWPAQPGRITLADLREAALRLGEFVGKVVRNERVYARVAAHDVAAIHAALIGLGIRPLVNAAHHLQADGMDLWIAGVDDLTQGQPDLAAALAPVPQDALLLLLAHNPDVWLEPAAERAALTLAGHTHGGQVRFPGLGAVHTQGTHLPRRRPSGWFSRGPARLFVTRGVGESLPLRLGVDAQAALIRLVPARSEGRQWGSG